MAHVEGIKHRLEAVLAADAAGYSRLMAADELSTVDALDNARAVFRERIEAQGGRVVDMAGDSVLAVFETAAGAVRAAVAVQDTLDESHQRLEKNRQLRFRIGVHLGDLIEKSDGTVYGDGVNVAAQLQGLAEPGGILVSDAVQGSVQGKIPEAFVYAGQHTVKNISRPVRAFRVMSEEAARPRISWIRSRRVAAGASSAALVVAALAGLWLWRGGEDAADAPAQPPTDPILAMPSGPSIAVLPFDNLSGDPDQEFFADGITEDFITRLSRFPSYLVIARNTTFQYKNKAVDVRELGRELGVDFVLEGSVRRAKNTVRITAQLIDTTSGAHIWAETFDRTLSADNIFGIQDEITERVATTLADTFGAISLKGYERSKTRNVADLTAYECVLGAHGYYATDFTPREHARVRDCLEWAVDGSPSYADAWAWLAAMYRDEHMLRFNPRPEPLTRAEAAARRALELDPDNQEGHLVLAHVYFFRHELQSFKIEARRTVSVNPNSADALASMGLAMALAGEWDAGLQWTSKAMRLNPRHPPWFHTVFLYDHYRREAYQNALAKARLAVIPGFFWSYMDLAAVLGKLGRDSEAMTTIATLRELYPGFSLDAAETHYNKWNYEPGFKTDLIDGLRRAGVPDGAPTD